MSEKKLPGDFEYLRDMYNEEESYPVYLVDQVRDLIKACVHYIESGDRTTEEIQAELDKAVIKINGLEKEFDEHGIGIETMARECISDTIDDILHYFEIDISRSDAIRERNW